MSGLTIAVVAIFIVALFEMFDQLVWWALNPYLAKRYIKRAGNSLKPVHHENVFKTLRYYCHFFNMRYGYKILLIGLAADCVPYAMFYIRERCGRVVMKKDVDRFYRVKDTFCPRGHL